MATRKNDSLLLAIAGVGAALALRSLLRKQRLYSLRGRVVLITGGSRGLGLVLAREFGREGARLALCARDADELARAERELIGRNATVFTHVCDLSDQQQVEAMVAAVEAHYGRIDVLVNNAGVIQVGPMEAMEIADYEEAMKAHFYAPLYTATAVLPGMKQRRQGRIVNIASIGGKVSVPHLLPYSASKFALVGLSEGMRAELLKDNVYVTTVCPGLMRTGSHENAIFKGNHRAEYSWFSIGDALPFVSMSAESAAKQIITACKQGDAEIVLSVPAQVLSTFHALFPGATADLLGLCNWIMPQAVGEASRRFKGMDSHTALVPSLLTATIDKAARENNEL